MIYFLKNNQISAGEESTAREVSWDETIFCSESTRQTDRHPAAGIERALTGEGHQYQDRKKETDRSNPASATILRPPPEDEGAFVGALGPRQQRMSPQCHPRPRGAILGTQAADSLLARRLQARLHPEGRPCLSPVPLGPLSALQAEGRDSPLELSGISARCFSLVRSTFRRGLWWGESALCGRVAAFSLRAPVAPSASAGIVCCQLGRCVKDSDMSRREMGLDCVSPLSQLQLLLKIKNG